jgi:ABC-type uncharacterized transport system permease subunit
MNALLHVAPIATVLIYGLASIWYARALVPEIGLELRGPRRMLVLGLACHLLFVALLALGAFQGDLSLAQASGQVLRFPTTLCAISFVVVALFLLLERRLKLSVMGVFIAPLAALILAVSAVLFHFWEIGQVELALDGILIGHVVSLVLCHAVSLFAVVASLALIAKERLLRQKRDTFFQKVIPALTSLDAMLQWSIASGLVLMSAGLALGFVLITRTGVQLAEFEPRVAWSMTAFVVYAGIAFMRIYLGWRGSRLAWLALFACSLLIVSAFAANLAGGSFHAF